MLVICPLPSVLSLGTRTARATSMTDRTHTHSLVKESAEGVVLLLKDESILIKCASIFGSKLGLPPEKSIDCAVTPSLFWQLSPW